MPLSHSADDPKMVSRWPTPLLAFSNLAHFSSVEDCIWQGSCPLWDSVVQIPGIKVSQRKACDKACLGVI
jgi:hypothetical protein